MRAAGETIPGWTWIGIAAVYLAMLAHVVHSGDMSLPVAGFSLVLAGFLCALTHIDFRTYRLPNALTFPMTGAGLVVAWLIANENFAWHLAGAVAGYLLLFLAAWLYRRLRGRDGVGLGDAKLLAGAGAWLGLSSLPGVLLLGSLLALAQVLAVSLVRRRFASDMRIPFGPALALATWILWLYGPLSPA